MKTKLILVIALVVLFFVSTTSADVIMPGQKTVGFCYSISNVEDYSDFVFVIAENQVMGTFKQVSAGDCVGFYKFATPTVYAMKKTDFNLDYANVDNSEKEKITQFMNDSKAIKSNIQLKSYGVVSDTNPLQSVETVLFISSLNENKFDLKKDKVVFAYVDGLTEEKSFESQDKMPAPTRNGLEIFYWLIPLIALIIIVVVVWNKKKKK